MMRSNWRRVLAGDQFCASFAGSADSEQPGLRHRWQLEPEVTYLRTMEQQFGG